MKQAVIMAGGRGLRLHPLTDKTPKPLLPVGQKPMLQTIVERFVDQGIRDITLSVNYHADLIEAYFGDGVKFGARISYIREVEPMGTAGALSLFNPQGPYIVSNADVLADIDFDDMLVKHVRSGKDATVALGLHQYQVPFGVSRWDGDQLIIDEKPIESFHVAAGIYALNPIKVPPDYLDMPDLLRTLKTGAYAIQGTWFDVGRFEDLAAAHINWHMKVAS